MTETAAITGAITSLNAAFELSKALIGIRDLATIQSKVIELQGQILAAQSSALAAQENQSTLLELVRKLEKQVADLKEWVLRDRSIASSNVRPPNAPGGSALAYALKDEAGSTEPKHFLCPNCFQEGRKSILQQEVRDMC